MEELIRIALVGTSKAAVAAVDAEHPCDALVARLGGDDREDSLLLRAGARAVFEQCGRVAAVAGTPPEPCPDESRPSATHKLARILQDVLGAEKSSDVLIEFLKQLAAAGILLPPELLPQALDVANKNTRRRLLPVLGQRGRWLSRFNPDWSWATAGESLLSGDRDALIRQWDEGDLEERIAALDALRRCGPDEARKLIESVIDKEKPEHRVRLIESLQIELGPEDEPFLESRLDDRSEQVRRAAAALLARLPDSALARRMRERADAILSAQTSWLRRKRLCATPPEEIDKTWVRDGVPAKPPSGRGKRAVWTEAVLGVVPPSRWSERFTAEPAELIQAVRDDDFAEAVLAGWTTAAAAFTSCDESSAAWLRPLWDHWIGVLRRVGDKEKSNVEERLQAIGKAMTGGEMESALMPMLDSVPESEAPIIQRLLPLTPRPWSLTFSRHYLTTVRRRVQSRADLQSCHWAGTLVTAALAFPREVLAEALAPWSVAESEGLMFGDALGRMIETSAEVIRLRQTFYEELTLTQKSPG